LHYEPIIYTIDISASAATIWEALTEPTQLQQWMTENRLDITTTWQPGTPIIIRGTSPDHSFENRGTIMQFQPEAVLEYTHLSSLSQLQDAVENYTSIKFQLSPTENGTHLQITLSNFPTESIYRHFAFYWRIAIHSLKKYVENNNF